jgi:phosphoserine phosphatase
VTDLSSWVDGASRAAIEAYVASVTIEGRPSWVAPEERIAVFDNDGTLWCEKPMPVELGHILVRLASMVDRDASLRDKQPWKAAHSKDYAWLSDAMTKHYQGDDADLKVLMGGVVAAYAGVDVDEYAADAGAFVTKGMHPTLGRTFASCTYQPMVELLRHLEANGFTTYIASGGDRDFMRPFTLQAYGIPSERVIGSSNALQFVADYTGTRIVYQAQPDIFDDGDAKPVRIWSRTGRRPIVAVGNSNGDVPMLRFAEHPSRPSLSILVNHDDAAREFAYQAGAEQALETAERSGWTVVSMKDDWTTVFPDLPAG